MRLLAVLLLLANAAFFGWHFWLRGELGEAPAHLPVESAAALVRLDEVPLDDFPARVPVSLGAPRDQGFDGACFAVGPLNGDYSEGAAMGRVREWLKSRGGVIRLRRGNVHELVYYWLHLPPAGTRDAARDSAAELAANAFPGAGVIPEGNMKNAVSIGLYGLRAALERDLARLETRGFEPETHRVRRTGTSLWFVAGFPAGYEFPGKRFSVAFPGLEVLDTVCPAPREPSSGAPGAAPRIVASPPDP